MGEIGKSLHSYGVEAFTVMTVNKAYVAPPILTQSKQSISCHAVACTSANRCAEDFGSKIVLKQALIWCSENIRK